MERDGVKPLCSELKKRGFRWIVRVSHDGTLELSLRSNLDKPAASVFLHYDVSGFNWFVWDQQGCGGENSKAPTVEAAIAQAEQATTRWGKH